MRAYGRAKRGSESCPRSDRYGGDRLIFLQQEAFRRQGSARFRPDELLWSFRCQSFRVSETTDISGEYCEQTKKGGIPPAESD
ncbi:hypothetical protein CBM2631_A320032 [Cupriavidus taiwanensis]|nr:hypothetical protein CBM2631_A320032 [Cupriavidus taiwanensis]